MAVAVVEGGLLLLLFGVGARGARHGTEGFGGRIMGVVVLVVALERRDGESVEVFEGGGGLACGQSRVIQEMKRETFHARHFKASVIAVCRVPAAGGARRRSGPALLHDSAVILAAPACRGSRRSSAV